MSVHFLMDMFTSPATSATIVDVIEPTNGQSITNGGFVVRIPSYAVIDPPTTPTLTNVLTAKYSAVLSGFSGLTTIKYDALVDTSSIDMSATTQGVFGTRGCVALPPSGVLQSVSIPMGGTPASVVVVWEVFTYIDSDVGTSRYTRTYNEVSTTSPNTTASVSTNNGSNYTAALDRSSTSISGGSQGSNLIVRITNASAARLYIGSWAVLY